MFLDSFTVNSLPAIVVNPVINNVNCFGGNNGSVSLTVTGGSSPYTYLWSNNATTQNEQNITAGTYAVTVTDAALCNTVVSGISVTQPVALSATITSTPQLCNNLTDGTATITVTGGTSPYQYSWSNGMSIPAITGLTTAEYYVTATDVNNCIYSDSVFVAIVPSMLISAIDTPPSCPTLKDGFILTSVTNGTHPYSYIWSNGQSTAHATGLGAGNYSVTIADANGCSLTDNFLLQAPGAPTVSASATPDSLSLGQSTVLTAISNNNTVTYNWTPSYGLSCINCPVANAYPYTTTLYTIVVVDSNGCTAADSVLITVSASGSVYIPNAFTPNGDGNNDVFQIYGEGIKIIDLKVFNRWGEKVYESNNQFEGWDGTYKGSKQNPSVFVYEANITYLNDKKDFKKGSVTLIR